MTTRDNEIEKVVQSFRLKFYLLRGSPIFLSREYEMEEFWRTALTAQREATVEKMRKDLLAIADAGEYEDLRREVANYKLSNP